MNLRQTESLKNDINQKRFVLEGWRASFKNKIEEIYQEKEDLGEIKIQWDKTLNLERDEKLPSQVYERIKTNLTEVNKLAEELTERNNALLTKQDEDEELSSLVDEALFLYIGITSVQRSNLLDETTEKNMTDSIAKARKDLEEEGSPITNIGLSSLAFIHLKRAFKGTSNN